MNEETTSPVHIAVDSARAHLVTSLADIRIAIGHLMEEFNNELAQIRGATARASDIEKAGNHLVGVANSIENLLSPPESPVVEEAPTNVVSLKNYAKDKYNGAELPRG